MDNHKNGFRIIPPPNEKDSEPEKVLTPRIDGSNNSFKDQPSPGQEEVEKILKNLFVTDAEQEKGFQVRAEEISHILNLIPVGIIIINPENHTILDVNAHALKLIGRERKDVIGFACQSFICPARSGECPLTDLGATIDNEEKRLLTVNEGALYVLKTVIPIEYEGRPALLECVTDISVQKQAQLSVKERERAFALMAAAIQDAVVAVDQSGKAYFWNRAAEEMFGYPGSEVLGQEVHHLLVPEEYREKVAGAFQEWQQTGKGMVVGKTVELTAQHKNRELFPVELSLSSVFVNNQWNAIAMIRNISERKQAELELKRTSERMSEWIAELEQSNLEMNLLRQMGELLQACSSIDEAHQVVGRYAPRLFVSSAGCLYTHNEEHKAMELAVSWGTVVHSEYFFHVEECWALRRNQLHVSDPGEAGFRCRHLEGSYKGAYLDVPIMLSGELLGLMYVELSSTPSVHERAQKLAPVVAEHLALSFSNLKLRERLREQSIRDPLTHLFNRRYMIESLERELHRANRHHQPISIIVIDIDDFKQINDNYGHDAGDAVLKEVSNRMLGVIRGSDFACRWGGEEFVIVMPSVPLEKAGKRAEELREMVGQFPFIYNDRNLGLITVSLGVAVYPDHGTNADQVLIEADRALYSAKNSGKNQVVIA